MTLYRLFSVLLIAAGGYLVKLSYVAYSIWQEYLKLGDFSGAELFELKFTMTALPGFIVFFMGAFLLGRSF